MFSAFKYLSMPVYLLGLVLTLSLAQVQAQAPSSDFEEAACMFEVPALLTNRVQCGYLTVPEFHKQPDSKTIRLAVAIIKSTGKQPRPDPLVMLQGGPGGSTIDSYSSVFGYGKLGTLLEERDVILFDQRGTMYSEPALMCSESWDLTRETIERRLTRAETNRLGLEATTKCRERLVAEGVNLAAFNSVENASDVEALRQALGYDQINLYGVSYGTLLALHTMRDHPEGLRTVILDAVVPTQTNFIPAVVQSQQRAFRELFAACKADPDCDRYYPNLEQVFFELSARLNQEPARIPMTDPETKKTYQAVIDGDAMESLIFQFLYATEIIPALPHVIYQMQSGDYSFLSRVGPLLLFDRSIAYGMYSSVICAEDADFNVNDVDTTGVRPELAEYAREDAQSMLDTCKIWQVPELDLNVDAPVKSDIPTLIMNGRFDPITPPANGEQAAQTLSNSTVVTFGFSGHGAATTGPCAEKLMQAFLDNPQQKLDTSCVSEKQAPTFISPATTHFTKLTTKILDALENNQYLPLALAIMCLVPLLSLLVVLPIAWLIRRFSPRTDSAQASPLYSLTRLAAFVTLFAGLAFIIGLILVIAQAVQQGDETGLLFGLPSAMGWISAAPWLMMLAAVTTLVGSIMLWLRRIGPGWKRAYFTLMALAAMLSAGAMLWLVV